MRFMKGRRCHLKFPLVAFLLLLAPLSIFPAGTDETPDYEAENIRESAFRQLILQQDSSSAIFCLSVGLNRDGTYANPGSLFMKRFSQDKRVKKASDCIEDKTGPSLAGVTAVLLTVEELKYLKPDLATVRVHYFREVTDSGAAIYTLERSKDGTWKVTNSKSVTITKVGR
jgi:hypothetical protein